jgi:hypothetical protein
LLIRSGENKIAQLAIESEFQNYLPGTPSYFDFIGIVLKYINIDMKSLNFLDDVSVEQLRSKLTKVFKNICVSSLKDKSKLTLYTSVEIGDDSMF